jgi:hypothetical protein
MRTIGTDMSLKECKKEGYLMLQYDARKKFDTKQAYNVFAYCPAFIIEESQGEIDKNALIVDTVVSWEDLQEIYQKHKDGIDKFATDVPELMSKKEPDFYDLLFVASTINAYCGLP